MDIKWQRVNCFEIFTPKLNTLNNEYEEKRFDLNEFVDFVNSIMSVSLEQRGYDSGNKVIVLESFGDSDDSDFLEGYFTSTRYGIVTDLVHRRTFVRRKSNKTPDEGDENKTYFVIDKNTGRLYLQNDSQRLVTKKSIDEYLRYHLGGYEHRIKQLNIDNAPLLITPRNFFAIKTILSDDFFMELSKLLRIKKATFQIKHEVDVNNDVVNEMRRQSEIVNGIDLFEYSLVNKERGGGIGRVEQLIKYLEELDKYENVIVTGKTSSNQKKIVKLEDHPKHFDVQVTVNENGVISQSDLISGIVELIKKREV